MNKIQVPTQVVEEIVKKAMKVKSQEDKKAVRQRKDWRLRNTRLLLKNYRLLEEHCKGIEVELTEYEDYIYDPEELELHSLMKYKAKTAKMLLYFTEMFQAYGNYCKRQGEAAERRFKVTDRLYVSDNRLNIPQVAEYFNINNRTVYKDVDKAIEELSIFLFGLDSLQDFIEGKS